MGHALLFSEVLGSLTVSGMSFLLLVIASVSSYKILRHWEFSSSSAKQYKLEQSSFLISLIVKTSLFVKIILFPYFFYILQMLSSHLPGAMCAAGVVNANIFGPMVIFFKLLTLFTGSLWFFLDRYDLNTEKYLLTVKKQKLFFLFFFFFTLEFISGFLFFYQIDLNMVVQCCSILYGIGGEIQQGYFNFFPFEYPLYLFL